MDTVVVVGDDPGMGKSKSLAYIWAAARHQPRLLWGLWAIVPVALFVVWRIQNQPRTGFNGFLFWTLWFVVFPGAMFLAGWIAARRPGRLLAMVAAAALIIGAGMCALALRFSLALPGSFWGEGPLVEPFLTIDSHGLLLYAVLLVGIYLVAFTVFRWHRSRPRGQGVPLIGLVLMVIVALLLCLFASYQAGLFRPGLMGQRWVIDLDATMAKIDRVPSDYTHRFHNVHQYRWWLHGSIEGLALDFFPDGQVAVHRRWDRTRMGDWRQDDDGYWITTFSAWLYGGFSIGHGFTIHNDGTATMLYQIDYSEGRATREPLVMRPQ